MHISVIYIRFDSKARRFTKTLVIKLEVELQMKIRKADHRLQPDKRLNLKMKVKKRVKVKARKADWQLQSDERVNF